jgi:FKBP-type peptidyl-prolyl cis-trans isomerase FklB
MVRKRSLSCLSSLLLAACGACGSEPVEVREAGPSNPTAVAGEPREASQPRTVERENGLRLEIDKGGKGPQAGSGSTVRLHYEAFLSDAETPFDSTYRGGMPLCVKLVSDARPRVIDGLRLGLTGLRAGTRATLHIPSALAWGANGNPSIGVGENADVTMTVHLLSVE